MSLNISLIIVLCISIHFGDFIMIGICINIVEVGVCFIMSKIRHFKDQN
jgi:hypothetical protein